MKNNKIKTLLALTLTTSLLGSCITVMADQRADAKPNATIQGSMMEEIHFRYSNEQSDSMKNKNISAKEAADAKKERSKNSSALGYIPDEILVGYDKEKIIALAEEKGLENYFEIVKNDIINNGDDAVTGFFEYDDSVSFIINLNDNKTVPTAMKEYESLEYVMYADPNAVIFAPESPIEIEMFRIKGVLPVYREDAVVLGAVHENACADTTYRWEYCKIGENTWHTISDWSSSEWCTWYPDANDNYAVVCKASYNGNIFIDEEFVWYISRPQMQKKLTGKCAVPTSDGLLFGCTSNVTKNDTDYYTSCYIWSHEKQAWITQSSYRASDCAWFKVSSLPKGTYMMYTCTEKMMPNGEKRKLSSDYYLFSN